ncbi:Protein MSP1 [Cytospora mali]|uniref:Protein MSP1 n=1 Tax=Cytospora mali TaxID=578113 RepID=A0A194WBP6_CYTMA|nr:Protein MSP1 [Valsa mali]
MHAVGTRARLPAARCLRAQAQAKAKAQLFRYETLTSLRARVPLAARLGLAQARYVSSQPNGSNPPDKPDSTENEGGKENGEQAQPPANPEISEAPSDTKKQQLFSPPAGGRNRSSNGTTTNNGLPPVDFPQWFLDGHVQILKSEDAPRNRLWDKLGRYFRPEEDGSTTTRELSGLWASSVPEEEGNQNTPEQAIGRELLSTVSAELGAKPPPTRATKDPKRRPISLLYVHNYKGSRVANDIVSHIGDELGADVIHLDAVRLARIIGPYLGSTLHFGRGNMSMLGYTAAEANGRSLSTASPTDSDDEYLVRGMGVMKFLAPGRDDRASWDDLKLSHVLKEIINSPCVKRKRSGFAPSKPERLILHVHNYVELAMTTEGVSIIDKLRTVVDRLWQEGSSIIIVGSTSNDKNAPVRWHSKLKELSTDCYPIVFSPNADEVTELKTWEELDYLQDNMNNINWMLSCLKSEPINVQLPTQEASESDPKQRPDMDALKRSLSSGIYSNHWVYRLATQAIGYSRTDKAVIDASTLAYSYKQMERVDKLRSKLLEPRSPASDTLPSSSPLESLISLGNTTKSDAAHSSSRPKPPPSNLDEEEKKLLTGLVNVEDIHTTFNEVVAPPEIRESLMALTTLSLQHPKAFSYGVLARERIHGCLLYGPPGTGKTLMAKAVAKGSGANMLEISAASINDMWVGNSEKNVRAVFSLARKMSPMVVFLDEADALLGSRGRQPNRGGQRETINQFLREWDGLTNALDTQQIFIMVSTNRPQDLDEAVLRRLPRRILVDLPLRDARLAILQSLLRDEVLDASVSLEKLATDTELYSGSDLKNLAVAAAMEAAKEELAAAAADDSGKGLEFPAKRTLTRAHFDKAVKDISGSISEDMQSLKAIRKFDEQYGDARRKKKGRYMGFEVVPQEARSEDAMVRNK